MQQTRQLKDGAINAYWIMTNNNLQAGANIMQEGLPRCGGMKFYCGIGCVPHRYGTSGRFNFACRHVGGKEGAFGNAERRTQFWHQLVDAPAEAKSDLWQLLEFAKYFTVEEVWPKGINRQKAGISRQNLPNDILFKNGKVNRFELAQCDAEFNNQEAKSCGFTYKRPI